MWCHASSILLSISLARWRLIPQYEWGVGVVFKKKKNLDLLIFAGICDIVRRRQNYFRSGPDLTSAYLYVL